MERSVERIVESVMMEISVAANANEWQEQLCSLQIVWRLHIRFGIRVLLYYSYRLSLVHFWSFSSSHGNHDHSQEGKKDLFKIQNKLSKILDRQPPIFKINISLDKC